MATDPAARSRPDPTRRLWQVPVFALGLTAALAVHGGWLPVGKADPGSAFLRDVAALRAAAEAPAPDATELRGLVTRTAAVIDAFPEHAALADFALGSGYARLAEMTAAPAEARDQWKLAREHFDRVAADRLPDPADAPRLAFRAAKTRAALGLPQTATAAEVELLRTLLLKVPVGEEPGEANRLAAELYLRNPVPTRVELEKARDTLTVYLTDAGLTTPNTSLFRAKLLLCRVHLKLGDADKARQLLAHLRDAPAEIKAPAKAELARIYMTEDNWAKAAEEWEQVRATAPLPPGLKGMAAYHLGLCRLMLGSPGLAAPLFEEAAKAGGPESPAGSVRLAELKLKANDPDRHKEAVALLAAAVKPGSAGAVPAVYQLVKENEVRAAFETAVQVLLADGAHEDAFRVAEAYAVVAANGRDAEKRAEVLAAWGGALGKAGGESAKAAAPKFAAAAAEYAALAKGQSAPSAKADLLRRAAAMHRAAGDPAAALAVLGDLVKLPGVPDGTAGPVWYEYAVALMESQQPAEALAAFKQAMLTGGPASTAARYQIARQLLDAQDRQLAPLGLALLQQIAGAEKVTEPEQPTHERALLELAYESIRARNFAEAEARLRKQLDLYRVGPEAEPAKVVLGVCLLQRATKAAPADPDPPRAAELREEALALFLEVRDAVARRAAPDKQSPRDKWLWTQAGLRVLQTYLMMGKPDKVLAEAAGVIDRTRGTVEELIALQFMYFAYKQANRREDALQFRARMAEVFAQLKQKPGAFPQASGEWSQDWWEKWFAPAVEATPKK